MEKLVAVFIENYGASGIIFSLLVVFVITLINLGLGLRTNKELANHNQKIDTQQKFIESQLRETERVSQAKWELKYKVCLQALSIIDGAFSHQEWTNSETGDKIKIVKQPISTVQARDCMGKLALTCSGEIANEFARLLVGNGVTADELNGLRNMIRKELGFGDEIEQLSEELTWLAYICGDPEGEDDPEQISINYSLT